VNHEVADSILPTHSPTHTVRSMSRRVNFFYRIDPEVAESFKTFCRANRLFIEQALESVLRDFLTRQNIPIQNFRKRPSIEKAGMEGASR
jgi:hypothetical protein